MADYRIRNEVFLLPYRESAPNSKECAVEHTAKPHVHLRRNWTRTDRDIPRTKQCGDDVCIRLRYGLLRQFVCRWRRRFVAENRPERKYNVLQLRQVASFVGCIHERAVLDRKSTRLNSSHSSISYAVFC